MDAPLQGDTGGHIGAAPTKLYHIFPRIPHKQNNHLRAIHPNETNRPIRNLPKRHQPPICNPPLPISTKPCGVPIPHRGYTFDSAGLASATSLPWVTMQERRLPPWGLYFFSSHIITTRGEQMVSCTKIGFKKYNADGIGSPPRLYPG